ncbi:unnamed protein product, partial [Allacma fusca]
MESLLTGIPQETCQIFKDTCKDLVHFEELVKYPSIKGLKNLVSLKFYCKDFPFEDDSVEDGSRYFSNLTKWFILEPMGELQIRLAFPEVTFGRNGFIYPPFA